MTEETGRKEEIMNSEDRKSATEILLEGAKQALEENEVWLERARRRKERADEQYHEAGLIRDERGVEVITRGITGQKYRDDILKYSAELAAERREQEEGNSNE